MKKILLKNIETEPTLNYRESLKAIVQSPVAPQAGVTIDEMRKSVRILNILEDAKDNEDISLEDADYDLLKQKVEKFPYSSSSKTLLDFIDSILNAETVA